MVKFEKKNCAFSYPIIGELRVGDVGVIGEGTVYRKNKEVFISKSAFVFPLSYWAPGFLKIKKTKNHLGAGSIEIEGKHAKIACFSFKEMHQPNWWLRLKGFAGPQQMVLEMVHQDNWWYALRVEDLIGTLGNVCGKRSLPEWYDTVIAYVVHRISVDKVLKFQEITPLLHQVSGVVSLEPINQALRLALRDDISRYKELFSDDTVDKHLTGLLEIPEERNFIKELQEIAGSKRTAIGFATNGNGNGHSKN